MRQQKTESGFTIAEMIVTLVVLSIFLTLFFQLFLLGLSQKKVVTLRATANDIAMNNLRKISTKTLIPAADACDSSTNGSGNPNNALLNSNLNNDGATGNSIIGRATSSTNTFPSPMAPETITGTGLPSSTIQTLYVIYPQGCFDQNPAKIISTVTYGMETVTHATYVVNQ
jgi:prepilin-type N-terminal cleavage/methylation domain-containing protein